MSSYKESYFDRLQDYIASGCKGELTPEERDYEDLLFSTSGIIRREGRPSAQAWLMADRGCSRHVADRICSEAINLFYATDSVRAEAWRNLLFEKLLNAARFWEKANIVLNEETGEYLCKAKGKDYEAYVKIIKQAAAVKQLSEKVDTAAPVTNNMQINVYGNRAQDLELPPVNKQVILQSEHFRGLEKRHQERLEMEAGLKPLDIDALLDNSIELANEVTGE